MYVETRFLAIAPSALVRAYRRFFLRTYDGDIFCELLSIKEPQTVLQIKKLLYKAIGKWQF